MRNFLKIALPVVAFALASAGAVGTNAAKSNEGKTGIITAFVQNPSSTNCLAVQVDCSQVNTHQVCMSSEATPRVAWLKNNAGACQLDLYKVIH